MLQYSYLMRIYLDKFFPLLFLLLLLIFGFLVRFEGIFTGNILFLFDNGRDLLYVRNIVVNHRLYLIGPSSGGIAGYFHGVLWYYLLTIPFFISRGNPASFTIFMASCSILSILFVFFVMKKIAGLYPAIFASLIYSFAFFSIGTSRFIWNPYPIVWLMPFYFASIYFFTKQKPHAVFFVSFITSLIFHFEAIYGITLILPFLAILFLEGKRKPVNVLFALLLFVVPILPSMLFDIRHHFLILGSLIKTLVSGGATITHQSNPVPFLMRVPARVSDLFTYTINAVTPFLLINVILFLGGVYGFIKSYKTQKLFFLLCSLILLMPLLIFLTLKYEVWSYYWIGSAPFYSLFLSYLLAKVIQKKELYMGLLLVLFVLTNPLPDIITHFLYYVNPGSSNLATQLSIVNSVYKDEKEPFSVYVDTPPVYDYVYRYLFWYEGYRKYKVFPNDLKQKLVYVIVDDNTTDVTGRYFITQVVKTPYKPMKSIQFPGNVFLIKLVTSPNEQPFNSNYLPVVE
jgi:hypothetical protein